MDSVKEYWVIVEDFYKRITPKCEQCKKLEEKIKIPLHYILMGITVVLALLFYLLTRNHGFFTYAAFFPSCFFFMKSIAEKKGEEKKWAAFWCFYCLFELVSKCLTFNIYFSIVKCAVVLFFAIGDDCAILIEAITKAYEYIVKGSDWYLSTYCSPKQDWIVCCSKKNIMIMVNKDLHLFSLGILLNYIIHDCKVFFLSPSSSLITNKENIHQRHH